MLSTGNSVARMRRGNVELPRGILIIDNAAAAGDPWPADDTFDTLLFNTSCEKADRRYYSESL